MLMFDGSIAVVCAPFSDGEVWTKYRNPDFGDSETPSVRHEPIHLLFSPWLRASVVQRSCLLVAAPSRRVPGLVFWPRWAALCYTISFNEIRRQTMLLSKEYVGYLARQMTQKLISGEFIETKNVAAGTEAMNTAPPEELH